MNLRAPVFLLYGRRFLRSVRLFCSSRSNKTRKKFQFEEMGSAKKPNSLGVQAYVLLTIPITTCGLGIWQTYRRQWKLNLISSLESKSKENPVSLPSNFCDLGNLEYRKVSVRGTFDHSRETFIGPRSRVSEDDSKGGGIISSGHSIGWHVVTPFQLSQDDRWILVNRGWVPKNCLDSRTRSKGQIEGEVDLVGVVRLNEPRQQFAPKNTVSSNQWLNRDVKALAETLNTEEIFLDADLKTSVDGGPIGGQTRISLRNDHFSYMLTWFSLSAATAFMWCKKFIFI